MNVTLTEEMKDMLRTQLPILATVTDAETPNIGPKRTLRAYDESSLIFNENTAGRHLGNIRAGSGRRSPSSTARRRTVTASSAAPRCTSRAR
jgi:predicted pyridoxine 5'-phosphate oxidase superfamily flavin-nucleotide-binding protein